MLEYIRHRVVILSGSYKVYTYFSWSKSLARTGDEEKSCTNTFVAAKTLPQYLFLFKDFANGSVPVCYIRGIVTVYLIKTGGLAHDGLGAGKIENKKTTNLLISQTTINTTSNQQPRGSRDSHLAA